MADIVDLGAWRRKQRNGQGNQPSSDASKAEGESTDQCAHKEERLQLLRAAQERHPAGSAQPPAAVPDITDANLQARVVLQRSLTKLDRSEAELRGILAAHDLPQDAIEVVIGEAVADGRINDEEVARQLVEGHFLNKGLGAVEMRRRLAERLLDQEAIDRVLAGVSDEEQVAEAIAVAKKRLRQLGAVPPSVQRRRISATLARKGFPSGIIEKAIAGVLGGSSSNFSPLD